MAKTVGRETLYSEEIAGAPAGRERNEVRTFFQDVEEDIEIPIYDIPVS